MKKINIRYLLALYWLWNIESWEEREDEIGSLNNKCPLIQNFKYRFSIIRKQGLISKGSYSTLDKSIEYYFSKSDLCSLRVFKVGYSDEQLDSILKEFLLHR